MYSRIENAGAVSVVPASRRNVAFAKVFLIIIPIWQSHVYYNSRYLLVKRVYGLDWQYTDGIALTCVPLTPNRLVLVTN
jgi:hypothetical protein